VSAPETFSDGNNLSASGDSDSDIETDRGYEAKNQEYKKTTSSYELLQETQYSYR
jgi:hypothetical protein